MCNIIAVWCSVVAFGCALNIGRPNFVRPERRVWLHAEVPVDANDVGAVDVDGCPDGCKRTVGDGGRRERGDVGTILWPVADSTRRSRQLDLEDLENVDLEEQLAKMNLPSLPKGVLDPDEAEAAKDVDSEWMGDFDGRDDELEAPWRREAEEIIMRAANEVGVSIQDIMWDLSSLRVTVPAEVDAEDVSKATQAIIKALEVEDERLRILDRHDLEVSTPGTPEILSQQRDFETFKGFEIIVRTENPVSGGEPRTLAGRLVERNSVDLIINQKGRMIRVRRVLCATGWLATHPAQIPYCLVEEVRLAPSKTEA